MPDFILELARPADAQHLAEMSRDYIETGLGWRHRKDSILRYMADANTNVTVARLAPDTPAIGFAIMTYEEVDAYLVLLAILPQWRRRGIGRQLVEWHLKAARVNGAQSLTVDLLESNSIARTFYESFGFSVVRRTERHYQNIAPALRMEMDLRVRAM